MLSRKSILLLGLTLIVLGFSSCVSKKKYLLTLDESMLQDSLRQARELHILSLQDSIASLQTSDSTAYADLQAEYVALQGQSAQETGRLNEVLKEKEAELENRGKLMEAFGRELEAREAKVKELNAIIARKDSMTKALLQKVETALVGFSEEELTVENRNGRVYVSLSDQLLFQSGSANVNKKGRDALLKLAEVLNKNPDIQIMIEGHTDNIPIKTPRFQDNWDLSVLRATSVVRILTWSGEVDPTRLVASGRGEHYPVANNTTKEGRAQNRRTEIILTPDLDPLFELLTEE